MGDSTTRPTLETSGRPAAAPLTAAKIWFVTEDRDVHSMLEVRLSNFGLALEPRVSLDDLATSRASGAGVALVDASGLRDGHFAVLEKVKAAGFRVIFLGDGRAAASNQRVLSVIGAGEADFLHAATDSRIVAAKIMAETRRLARAERVQGALVSPGRLIRAEGTGDVWVRAGGRPWRRAPSFTRTELKLLRMFLAHPKEVLDRPYILRTLWPSRAEQMNSETLNKHVQLLRRKLGPCGKFIRTVYGEGYRLLEDA